MSPKRLQEILERAERATPELEKHLSRICHNWEGEKIVASIQYNTPRPELDREFVAKARRDVLDLVMRVEVLSGALQRVQDALHEFSVWDYPGALKGDPDAQIAWAVNQSKDAKKICDIALGREREL